MSDSSRWPVDRRFLAGRRRLTLTFLVSLLGATLPARWLKAASNTRDRRFSSLPAGPLSPAGGWIHSPLAGLAPNQADIVSDGQHHVLRIRSASSGSAWSWTASGDERKASSIDWRWSVHGQPASSRLGDKAADDFAARLYLVFDYPLDRVPWGQRLGIRIARSLHGDQIPAAAICYVWHAQAATDTMIDSPYTSRVKMIVARGQGATDQWSSESRDIVADFRRAFGDEYGPGVPALQAVLVSADTDQGGGTVTAFFGDIDLA